MKDGNCIYKELGGFTNIMIKLPEDNLSIIILSNYFREAWQKIFKEVHDFATEANVKYSINKS